MVTYNPATLADGAAAFHRLAADRTHMAAAADTVAALPLPSAGSSAEKALSNRAEIVASAKAAIAMVGDQLGTLATNLDDTAAAYARGEAENVERVNRSWDDLGTSSARGSHHLPDPTPVPQLSDPSGVMTPFTSTEGPSLLPYEILDLVEFIASIPTDVQEVIRKYLDFVMLPQSQRPVDAPWYKAAMGQYQPISTVGDGYRQIGDAYVQAAMQLQLIGDAVRSEWTGDTADLAQNYLETLFAWLRWEVAETFHTLGKDYQDVAHALVIQAARAADAVRGYKAILQDLVVELGFGVAGKRRPELWLFKEIGLISKTVAKRILVVDTILQLMQVALNFLDFLRENTKIDPATIRPPVRR